METLNPNDFAARQGVELTPELFEETRREYAESGMSKAEFFKWWRRNRRRSMTRRMAVDCILLAGRVADLTAQLARRAESDVVMVATLRRRDLRIKELEGMVESLKDGKA